MAFTVDSTTIWDKLKSSTSNQDKAPKYKPTKDPLSDPKKGLKSKLAVNSTDKTPSQKKDAYYVEKDGESLDSTVVHKALVQYYKNKKKSNPQAFEGFPSWLGHIDRDEDVILQKEDEVEHAPKVEEKEHIPVSETKKSGTLQSGYTPLSSRPLFKSTHHSMKNLSLNSQNDATNESLSSSTDSYRPNAPKKAYSMRDRMKRK